MVFLRFSVPFSLLVMLGKGNVPVLCYFRYVVFLVKLLKRSGYCGTFLAGASDHEMSSTVFVHLSLLDEIIKNKKDKSESEIHIFLRILHLLLF